MRVAVVHDWLTCFAGAEKVLKEIFDIWPEADLYSTVDFLSDGDRALLGGRKANVTFVQKLPFAKTKYRNYLPLMPVAIEQLDLSSYDLVVSSSYAVAKGVLTGPDQVHISYVHSPIRYAWDLHHQYLKEAGLVRGFKSAVARAILHYIRLWDARTANGVDLFVANSNFIARRIFKVYRRDAKVVYPPVDIDRFTLSCDKSDFYLTASRMVPYKKIPLIVRAFSKMPDKRLVVVGDGPEMDAVKAVAGANVEILGYQSTERLIECMQRAKAFVFAAEEDFGIAPVEAQACGTPVIAFGKGGALETVVSGDDPSTRTGMFFYEQSESSIVDAVNRFEVAGVFDPVICRKNAERFSPVAFKKNLKGLVDEFFEARAGVVSERD